MKATILHMFGLTFTVIVLCSAGVAAETTHGSSSCKNIPGDPQWPSPALWAALNKTVDGRLVATLPLAGVCHTAGLGSYNEAACQNLKAGWDSPQTHLFTAGEIDSPWFQNQSCDPFTAASTPCELGNYVSYSISVSGAQDVVAGVKFARQHKIRLVVKNTGHDYFGKSTGKGGLALWTHSMNSTEIITKYASAAYSGPAIKLGAGVIASQADMAADAAGYRIVSGLCATVGVAGGYSQGGGHSALSNIYGLAADNVLEWEVVTIAGDHLIATPTRHTDLYWALSGGGGGTYGVVLSMTARLHSDGQVAGGTISFNDSSTSNDVFWDAVGAWISHLPDFIDAGNYLLYEVTNSSFLAILTAPDKDASELSTALKPFLAVLTSRGIPYTPNLYTSPDYLTHYASEFGPLPYGPFAASELLSNRLIPRKVVQNQQKNANLVKALRLTTKTNEFYLGCQATNAYKPPSTPSNAVLPAWRDSVSLCLVVGNWDWTVPRSVMESREQDLTDIYMPALVKATPGSGIYLNEGNFAQPDWQDQFYGVNYARLRDIKSIYDPEGVLYGLTAVGSEAWKLDSDGRLCPA